MPFGHTPPAYLAAIRSSLALETAAPSLWKRASLIAGYAVTVGTVALTLTACLCGTQASQAICQRGPQARDTNPPAPAHPRRVPVNDFLGGLL